MKSFSEFLNEASLNRFYNHFRNNKPILIVTASRADQDNKTNNKNNNEIRKQVRLAGFGYNRVKGTYKELIDDVLTPVEDDTVIVYGSNQKEDILYNLGLSLGKKYNQDSILFIGSKTNFKPTLISTRNDGSLGPIGTKHTLGKFHPQSISDVMTIIKGKSYHFDWDELSEAKVSSTMNEATVRKAFCDYLSKHDSLDDWKI